MSLDVYLTTKETQSCSVDGKIFIRENGQTKEISRNEWDRRFPGREPVVVLSEDETNEVYSSNITHNLTTMADEAGIYKHLWRPDEIEVTKARQLIKPLQKGLKLLKSNPKKFKKFNPSNGWGCYEGLVDFVELYLEACKEYPNADVNVSR